MELLLLEHNEIKVDVNRPNNRGITPYQAAVSNGRWNVVALLKHSGAKLDYPPKAFIVLC